MKRVMAVLAVAGMIVLAVAVNAADKVTKPAAAAATIKGELVDLMCYVDHGARGEAHKSCAMQCVSNGAPIGLLTDAGKLYLLTPTHGSADPFNKARQMMAAMVEVTGVVAERAGMSAIGVTDVKVAATAAK